MSKRPPHIENRLPFYMPVDVYLYVYQTHRRFQVFYRKGTKCVSCGVQGVEIIKWKDKPDRIGVHYDLITADGTLMTVDHIWPKCLGGKHHIDNLQPMCGPCNWNKKKADVDPEVEAYIASLA